MSTTYDLVIIGNGMAGNRLLQELVKASPRPESILVIGEEPRVAYNRVLLSPLLAGEMTPQQVELQGREWYSEHGIDLICADPVVSVDTDRHRIKTDSGRELGYHKLVFATGSRSTMPDLPGIDLQGVMGFRTWADVERMTEVAEQGGNAVVIGGGLLGLEAAEGLRKRGMNVKVLQRSRYLLNRQLDVTASALLRETLEARGLEVMTDSRLEAIEGAQGHVTGVRLQDGRYLSARLLVIAAGVTPEVELARRAGLACDRAIEVNSEMRTGEEDVYALGECCQFEGSTYGLVAPIWHQARVLAQQLTGTSAHYSEQPVATQLKVSGIELFSCGEIDPESADAIAYHDPGQGDYRKIWLRNGRVAGAVLYGDVRLGQDYFKHLCEQTVITDSLRDELLFNA
ncbi:NAD(P)/FAD-dependent oxidoreductase [Marinobacterium litorale]|uniref:NAD(P)/FAD-dependent oxidoreductase n=1 Tax=Marinobacterium litorale TaxID=404770 RepID=UPI00040A077E|nr:FAD-dependent oxidoreductase [Marinobacterium litorale]